MTIVVASAAWLLVLPCGILAQPDPKIMERFEEVRARMRAGETVTAAEQEFIKKVQAELNEDYVKKNPPRESTGLVPLCDLGKGTYKGEEGGLYPGGDNAPPPAHLKLGMAASRQVVPRDPQGRPSQEGKIVLLSIGMSNTTMEFQVFLKRAAGDKTLNPHLVPVDGAQGGQGADVTAMPHARFWSVVDERLAAAGVSGAQVQAVWIKQAYFGPWRQFPGEPKKMQGLLIATLHNVHDRFPNLRIAYLSSRIYAGYATAALNPEPHAYESAFAIKWIIRDQMAGNPELNCDPSRGAVRAPWVAWGPYLWADGVKGRKDGLVYVSDDMAISDRTHPSLSGREKVVKLLLDFFKHDPTSRPWFVSSQRSLR
ncbi:MAG: hypothetical protein ACE15B_15700 [Bryobacteraceae bacterium]